MPDSTVTPPLAVRVRGLGFSYRGRPALSGLDLEVQGGELFGVLGPNGGGKTTLFRILATLAVADTGEVEVCGRDPATDAAGVRRRLGVVFQSPALDGELTVSENLLCHGRLYGLRRAELTGEIGRLLERLGIADRRSDRVKTLSGGLARRVEIAKALLPGPQLLLLDEPSTGLDPGARLDLWRLLEELRSERGVTVLLTTHFIEEADRCDRLALIEGGRILTTGSPAQLKAAIGGDVVSLRTRAPEAVAEHLQRTLGIAAIVRDADVRFESVGGWDLVPRLIEALPGQIDAATVARPTLEDVFLRHGGRGLWEAAGADAA